MKNIKLLLLYDNIINYKLLEKQLNEQLKQGYVLKNSGFFNIGVFEKSQNTDFKYVVSYQEYRKELHEFYQDFDIDHVDTIHDLNIYKTNSNTELFNDLQISDIDMKTLIKKHITFQLLNIVTFTLLLFSFLFRSTLSELASTSYLISIMVTILIVILLILDLLSKIRSLLSLTHNHNYNFRRVIATTKWFAVFILLTLLIVDFSRKEYLVFSIISIFIILAVSRYLLLFKNTQQNKKPLLYAFILFILFVSIFSLRDYSPQHFHSFNTLKNSDFERNTSFLLNETSFIVVPANQENLEYHVAYYQVKETFLKPRLYQKIINDNHLNDLYSIDHKTLEHDDSIYLTTDESTLLKHEDSIVVIGKEMTNHDAIELNILLTSLFKH